MNSAGPPRQVQRALGHKMSWACGLEIAPGEEVCLYLSIATRGGVRWGVSSRKGLNGRVETNKKYRGGVSINYQPIENFDPESLPIFLGWWWAVRGRCFTGKQNVSKLFTKQSPCGSGLGWG